MTPILVTAAMFVVVLAWALAPVILEQRKLRGQHAAYQTETRAILLEKAPPGTRKAFCRTLDEVRALPEVEPERAIR